MWNDDIPEQVDEPTAPPTAAGGRDFLRMLLLWVPIATCLACMALAFLTLPAEETHGIPVTGGSVPPAPTLTPGEPPEPLPTVAAPPLASFTYKVEAMRRLEDCTMAFHNFFLIEQVAIHEPELIRNTVWRKEAAGAMLIFQQDCSPLGSLPPAPTAYDEVDRWLKLAAGEVASASSRFDTMLVENDADQISEISGHMLRFIEFTYNAERIIDHLEDRKEI